MLKTQSKKTITALIALLGFAIVALTFSAQAHAGGKRHFGGKYYKNPYLLKHQYVCEPQYIKKWVWNKHKGRKTLRLIRIKDRCNVYYR